MESDQVPEIRSQLRRVDLFEAFKTQMQRDFTQANFPHEFIINLPADYDAIHGAILTELERHEPLMMQLVYRVDISEGQLKRYLSENNNASYLSVVAELIIKRTLQKVITKQYYKQ